MTQYHSVNLKLSNLQLQKLKSTSKNTAKVILRLSSNMICSKETNFSHNLLLTDRQVLSLCKVDANKLLVNIKLSKLRKIDW